MRNLIETPKKITNSLCSFNIFYYFKGRAAIIRRTRRSDLLLPLTRTDNNGINRFILTAVPKYNNYIKRTTSWSTSQAEIVTVDDGTVFQYTIYRTNKSAVERQYLLLDRLFYGTEVYFFSDIMSITVGNNDIDTQIPSLMVNSEIVQSEDSKHNYIRNVIFQASHNLSTFYTLVLVF